MGTLIDNGLCQGAIIQCKQLNENQRKEIQEARAIANKRQKPCSEGRVLCVLTQDCDVESEQHKYVELVMGIPSKGSDPKLQRNRNFRKLQQFVDGKWYEFNLDLISVVPKSILLEPEVVSEQKLDERNLQMVIDWRVLCYDRKPLPHNFNIKIRDYLDDEQNGLQKSLLGNLDNIQDLYVLIEPEDEEHAEEYTVHFMLLLKSLPNEELNSKRNDIKNEFEKHIAAINQVAGLNVHGKSGELSADLAAYVQSPVETPGNIEVETLFAYTRITWQFLCYGEID